MNVVEDRFDVLTVDQLLDAAKRHQGLTSDYELAKRLEVGQSLIVNYRKGRSKPDDAMAERLGALANMDRGYATACMHAWRTDNLVTRDLWRFVAAKLRSNGTAAVVAILSLLITIGPDGGVSIGGNTIIQPVNNAGTEYTS